SLYAHFLFIILLPPISTPFPYTTLFRSISNFTLCLSFIFHYFLIDHLPCLFHNWKPTTIITIHKIILVFFTDKVIQCLPCIFFLQRLRTNRQRNFWIKYCSNSICNRESHQRNRFSKYLFCNEKIG